MRPAALQEMLQEIRRLARADGLSDEELARRAGITPEALSRLGKRDSARLQTIEALARVVGRRVALLPDDDYARDVVSGSLFDHSKWS